jgi:hypothetical protein
MKEKSTTVSLTGGGINASPSSSVIKPASSASSSVQSPWSGNAWAQKSTTTGALHKVPGGTGQQTNSLKNTSTNTDWPKVSSAWQNPTSPSPQTIYSTKQQQSPTTYPKPSYSSMSRQHIQGPANGKNGVDTDFPSLSSSNQSALMSNIQSQYSSTLERGKDTSGSILGNDGTMNLEGNLVNRMTRIDLSDQGSDSNQKPLDGGTNSSAFGISNYGLDGLLNVIRNPSSDIAMMVLGIDLSGLGLDLTSGEPLHLSFVSPWGDVSKRMDQLFPSCYNLPHTPPPLQQRFAQFQDDTLFYLFYNANMVEHLESVAKELCRRGWKWYSDWSLWIHPTLLNDSKETLSCVTFDPVRWEHVKRELPAEVAIHGQGLFAIE